MTLSPVKTAAGRRLRHPVTKAILPNVADKGVEGEDAKPVLVNLADPHWYKALRCGDIEIADPEATPDWYKDLHPAPATEPVVEASASVKAAPIAPAAKAAPLSPPATGDAADATTTTTTKS